MIIREGVVMLVRGVVIGILLAAATGKLFSGMVYQVGAVDQVAFVTMPVLLGLTTIVATWLPARRATHINPLTVPKGHLGANSRLRVKNQDT
jgi:putative ABC transport system permease protein